MTKQRARRAANERQRQRWQRRAGSAGADPRPSATKADKVDPVDLATVAIHQLTASVTAQLSLGERRTLREVALTVCRQTPVAAAVAADVLLRDFVGLARGRHWTVVDLVECSRRRLDRDSRDLLTEAMWHDRHGAGASRTWRAAVEEVARPPRRDPGVPWFAAFSSERGWSVEQSLDVLVGVLADVRVWPSMRPTTPAAPGGADSADAAMLHKVRALLAKAESTEFEHEAEAFTAKAQSLMARHAIDRVMLEDASSPTDVVVTRVWIDTPYVTAKAALYNAVGAANRCRVVLTEEFGFLTIVGEAGDVRATSMISASLQVQATRAMTAQGSRTRRDGTSSTRSFRQTFLVAYAGRIAERLTAAADVEQRAADPGTLVPVLAARARAVSDRFDELYPELRARTVVIRDAHGWQAGRAAADLAHLGVGEALEGTG